MYIFVNLTFVGESCRRSFTGTEAEGSALRCRWRQEADADIGANPREHTERNFFGTITIFTRTRKVQR